ncbi:MAG TPA: class I SAM-dependent methyltransferase [Candidatus Acidoferrales bacterium]|jgi:2-polyprenyl-3-methyl-5-hydroxy-6-metoxy-1,4-benzoquinol methylase|nr:class I SAM-dependent methyltransferase [Candidatus Acidoferrales bacterium]
MPDSQYEFKPFKYSSHYWILNALRAEKEPVRILDAGTASGYLGKVWRGDGHYVAGIEFDAATGEKARQYYNVFEVANLENYAFPARREFDYIVFADVLEHLRDPAAVLRRCIPCLKDSGKVIISVPNIANWIIRLSLLFGKFDYMDRGILDRTHLRFFTSRSLKQLMKEVSCEVEEIIPTPLPFQLVLPFTGSKIFAPFHEANYALTRCWKTLFAYQFVVVAAPMKSAVSQETGNLSAVTPAPEKEPISR